MVRAMKTIGSALLCTVFALSFSSCSFSLLKEKYAKNEAATAAYINQSSSRPKTNVEGVWYSPEWGMVVLNQDTNGKLTGVFQDYYHVKGYVSGKKAYIVLIDDDWTEYTVELTRVSSERLTGSYSSHVPFDANHAHDLTLVRIGD